jgi:tRNA (guanine37-N1)-methyltransferase
MRFDVVTLFPEMMEALAAGVIGRAQKQGLISLHCWNPRDYTHDVHKTVDDRPYGGGPGMVMKIEPLEAAINAARYQNSSAKTVYLSPQGQPFTQDMAQELSTEEGLILICGRYEGIDERLLNKQVDLEISIGDYVLSGGELPAMVLVDTVSRLIPGVLGHADSADQDSFTNGLLDCPHYTRPEILDGEQVPQVLLSGNHREIEKWRLQQSLIRTRERRPDLFKQRELTRQENDLIEHYDDLMSKTSSN